MEQKNRKKLLSLFENESFYITFHMKMSSNRICTTHFKMKGCRLVEERAFRKWLTGKAKLKKIN